jgi:lycopene cyclase domain-containing protein
MKSEYLLFHILVILGPLTLSFDKEVRYFSYWRFSFLAIFTMMIPFVLWDSLVTGAHWWFNSKYTLGIRLAGLPLGEWLFFLTVPFACLFVWQIIVTRNDTKLMNSLRGLYHLAWLFISTGIILFVMGKEYTGLVLMALALALTLDRGLKTNVLLQTRTIKYIIIITILMFIFNGYLTARPVVLYGEEYQLGIRLFTIPLEDFGYGYSLILLNTILYERLKGSANG